MKIDISLIKELRDRTGVGLADCQKALKASDGNIEEAIQWLRAQGTLKARAKEGRVNDDGLVTSLVEGNKAIILELNCETDFVAKNKVFQDLTQKIAQIFLASNASSIEEGLNLIDEDQLPITQLISDATLRTGEKISISRFEIIGANDEETLVNYNYPKNEAKIASLLKLKGKVEHDLALQLAMHVVARKPLFITREHISPEFMAQEQAVIDSQMANENKPPEILARIKQGKIEKQLAEYCLVDQPFISDDSKKVQTILDENHTAVLAMYRFQVGEHSKKD